MRALIVSSDEWERADLDLGLRAVFSDATVDIIYDGNHALESISSSEPYHLVVVGRPKDVTCTEVALAIRQRIHNAPMWAYGSFNDDAQSQLATIGVTKIYDPRKSSSFRGYVMDLVDFRDSGLGNGVKPTNGHK